MDSKNIFFVELNAYNIPTIKTDKRGGLIRFGEKNTYPQYLVDMYRQCSIHNAIIGAKVNYIVGESLNAKIQTPLFLKPNKFETTSDIFYKMALDYEIQEMYAIEVLKQNGVIISIAHIEAGRLRRSSDQNGWWYSTEWTKLNEDGERIENHKPQKIYFPDYNALATDERSIYIFKGYTPDMDYYAAPNYVGALSSIEAMVEIDNFHLNNTKNGYAAGTIISFNDGVPSDDEKPDIIKNLKADIGTTNAGGGIVVTFASSKENAPEVINSQNNNLDERFKNLSERCADNIFIAHKVTNTALFGVQTPGKLGNTDAEHLQFSYNQFRLMYVRHRQKDLLYGLSEIFKDANRGADIGLSISELQIVNFETPTQDKTNVAMSSQNYKGEEYFESVGRVYGAQDIAKYTEGDFIDDLEQFSFASDLTKNHERVLAVYSEFPGATAAQVAIILDLPLETVKKMVSHLSEGGYISKSGNVFKITDTGSKIVDMIPKRQSLQIVYSYEERPDAVAVLGKTRPFCQRLVDMSKSGKRWTREEIEGMKNDMSSKGIVEDIQDVWKYRGGWYIKPGDDTAVPYCRHRWVQHVIIE